MFIELDKISKNYSTKKTTTVANKEVSITIAEGEFIGLFGSNGSGKTTLIRELLGIISPDNGVIRVNGQISKKGLLDYEADIGYMSQTGYAALYYLRIKEAVEIVAKLKNVAINVAYQKLEEILNRFQMSLDLVDKYFFQLSGGQRRVFYLFLAIINTPKFLVLDEPSNDLDPDKRYQLWSLIEQINKSGTTILLVTHSIAEIESRISRVVFMKNGEVRINEETVTLISRFVDYEKVNLFFRERLSEDELARLVNIMNPYSFKILDAYSLMMIVEKRQDYLQKIETLDKYIGCDRKKIGLEDICFATD